MTVPGDAGQLTIGIQDGVRVDYLQGRAHFYENAMPASWKRAGNHCAAWCVDVGADIDGWFCDEVREMLSKLLMALVAEALDRGFLDGSIHSLDLTIELCGKLGDGVRKAA